MLEAAHVSVRGIPAVQVVNQGMPTPSLLSLLCEKADT